MWNPHYETHRYNLMYNYYAAGLFCLAGMTQTIAEIFHTWNNRHDIVMFTQHFTIVTGMVSTMIKIVNLWHRRSAIEEVIDLLNYERRMACNQKLAIYRDKIVTSTIRACKLLSLTFIIMVFWYAVFIYGKILFYHKGNVKMLPLSPLIPLQSNKSAFYWLLFVFDEAGFFYIAGTVASHDSLFMVFLIQLGAQLDLLKLRLKQCHDDTIPLHEANRIEAYHESKDLKIECVCRTFSQELSVNPIHELHACIKHHQKILRYVKLIQDIFNHTLLLQFASSLVMITMIGFQIIGEHKLNSNELIGNVTLLVCALSQLFLYCWFGTDIIVKSESINLSVYNTKWYLADKHFKSTLKILLCKGQNPIRLRVGYIYYQQMLLRDGSPAASINQPGDKTEKKRRNVDKRLRALNKMVRKYFAANLHGKNDLAVVKKSLLDPTKYLSALSTRREVGWDQRFLYGWFINAKPTNFLVRPLASEMILSTILLVVYYKFFFISTQYF